MNNSEDRWGISCGLWEKISQKSHLKYYGGKVAIDGKEYWVTMFLNDVKVNDKSPDFRLTFTETQETLEKYGRSIRPPKYEPKPFDQKQFYKEKMSKPHQDQPSSEQDIYSEYGEMVEIDDNFLL